MKLFTVMAALVLAASPRGGGAEPLSEGEAREIGVETYIYGYPLVTMEMTRRVMTNTAAPENQHAPMGQFYHARTYPDASFRDVTAPNADTLYSTAWLDLAKEPYVLSLPDMKGRYFLMPMLDAWTSVFADPGKRTTGTDAQRIAIVGPGWRGTLPEGIHEVRCPSRIAWVLGRIYSTGTPEDYAEVHALQEQCSLVPLSAYGKPHTPPPGKVDPAIDMKTPVREQVNALKAEDFFALFAELLKENPPLPADAPMVAQMARIGVVPGEAFAPAKLDPAVVEALQDVPKAALEKIRDHAKKAGTEVNGWRYSLKTGVYGTDYLQRAFVTLVGLGANLPQDAVYPQADVDDAGKPLDGRNRYLLRFPKGQMPPVNGFWSLTMYNSDFFFVPNPLNRYSLSPRNSLKANDDGSVDLLIQHESPGKEKESNWLPAPAGPFNLMMRLYWPKEAVLDGSWKIPPVQKAER